MNSLPVSERASQASSPSPPGSGSSRPPKSTTASPGIPRRSREVARSRTPGQSRAKAVTSSALAPRRCSQLSSSMSSCRLDRWPVSVSSGFAPGTSRRDKARSTVPGTSPGSARPDRSTKNTLPAGTSVVCWPTSMARRVFPQPPGPTTLTSRWSTSKQVTSATAAARPMKVVSGLDKLPGEVTGASIHLGA
jgi:hypothetical protein